MSTNINSHEIVLNHRCVECNRVTPVMYRIRTGFTITGIVCRDCYEQHYKEQYKTQFVTFNKPNDTENNRGVETLPQKSAFMRQHLDSNFLTEQHKAEKRQKNKNSKIKRELNTTLGNAMKAYYDMASADSISVSGSYAVLEFVNSAGETMRCYYSRDLVKDIIPRFLMNSKGKIVQYF